jgi:DNA primase
MYQTNSTNNINSAAQAKSFAHLQQELWESEQDTYNPDAFMIDQVFDQYHQSLKANPKLSEMLVRRKIDPDYIDHFHIGFADRTLGYELQSPKYILGSRNRGHLQRLGLLKPTGHEFFRGAMIIPYRGRDGKIIGAYGRRPRHQRRSPAYHLYWNAQQVPLFNIPNTHAHDSLILCKSAVDVLTLLTAGIKNVVATMGYKGLNEIQLNQLQQSGVRCICIAFDNTPTANQYALLVAQALNAVGIACRRMKLPLGHDVNRYAMTQTDVASVFKRLVDNAIPLQLRYGELVPRVKDDWLKQFVSIEDCVNFYLEEQKHSGNAFRTINTARIHLDRFQEYCYSQGIEQITTVGDELLKSYQRYLIKEKNIFTGQIISRVTQMERMDAVSRMLSRLYYYGIISESVNFEMHAGQVH